MKGLDRYSHAHLITPLRWVDLAGLKGEILTSPFLRNCYLERRAGEPQRPQREGEGLNEPSMECLNTEKKKRFGLMLSWLDTHVSEWERTGLSAKVTCCRFQPSRDRRAPEHVCFACHRFYCMCLCVQYLHVVLWFVETAGAKHYALNSFKFTALSTD